MYQMFGLRDGPETSGIPLGDQSLQYHQDCLLGAKTEEIARGLDDQSFRVAGALHASHHERVTLPRTFTKECEADSAQCRLVPDPHELNAEGALTASAAAVGQHETARTGFVSALDLAHIDSFSAPNPSHDFRGQDFLSNREMIDKQPQPLRTAQPINKEFRKRLL